MIIFCRMRISIKTFGFSFDWLKFCTVINVHVCTALYWQIPVCCVCVHVFIY